MKTTIKKIIEWFGKSNRYKHLLYAIVLSYLAGFVFTCGVAAGMEFKDAQWGGKWDWIDFWLTVAGAAVGGALRVITLKALDLYWLVGAWL